MSVKFSLKQIFKERFTRENWVQLLFNAVLTDGQQKEIEMSTISLLGTYWPLGTFESGIKGSS